MRTLIVFLLGALAAGFAVCALFFAKFWASTRDRLFLDLAIAFALFTAERASALFAIDTGQIPLWTYLLRLAGFLMIILALVDKNRRGRSP